MTKIYCDLILAGRWTLDKVPERWRAGVAEALGPEADHADD